MEESFEEYRNSLISAKQNAQNSFDKHLISLSGGSLGISIAFIKNIIGDKQIICSQYLLTSWILWTLSIALMLASFFTSRLAFDKAIYQVDNKTIRKEHPGGAWDKTTSVLNALGGICFLYGLIFIIIFVSLNLKE